MESSRYEFYFSNLFHSNEMYYYSFFYRAWKSVLRHILSEYFIVSVVAIPLTVKLDV